MQSIPGAIEAELKKRTLPVSSSVASGSSTVSTDDKKLSAQSLRD